MLRIGSSGEIMWNVLSIGTTVVSRKGDIKADNQQTNHLIFEILDFKFKVGTVGPILVYNTRFYWSKSSSMDERSYTLSKMISCLENRINSCYFEIVSRMLVAYHLVTDCQLKQKFTCSNAFVLSTRRKIQHQYEAPDSVSFTVQWLPLFEWGYPIQRGQNLLQVRKTVQKIILLKIRYVRRVGPCSILSQLNLKRRNKASGAQMWWNLHPSIIY